MSDTTAPTTEVAEEIGAPSDFQVAFEKAMGQAAPKPVEEKAIPEPTKPKDESKAVVKDSLTPEPPKPAEAKPEAKTPDLEDVTGLSPTASQKFKTIKANRDEWRTKSEQSEAKIKELTEQLTKAQTAPKAPVDDTEVKALKEEHARMSEELKRLGVERHPKFKAYFGAKEESIVNTAKNAVGAERAAQVEALLKQAPSEYRTQRLEELAEELSSLGQARLSRAIDDWDTTQAEKKTSIETEAAKWDQTVVEEQGEKQKRLEGIKTKFEGMAKLALDGSVNYDAFKEIEGDAEHNAKVANNRQFIKAFMSGKLKEEVFAFTPVLAAEALHLREKVLPALKAEMASEISKRDKIIADLQSASPSVDTPADKGAKKSEADEDFATVFAKLSQGA